VTESPEHLSRLHKHLDSFGEAELNGVPVKRMLCCGDPASLIVQRACAEKADLIFMPSHGGGILRRFLLGSVTAKVLHDAACPVWTGAHLERSPALDPADIHHIMCAVDFGPQSSNPIQWAASFASALQARLTVVHAALDAPPSLPARYMFQ
jgi:nucleotide-binding universal stress UspA family protein